MDEVDRQSLFTGTETPPEHLRIDAVSLENYLRAKLPEVGRLAGIEKFRGGQSNPTYKLTTQTGVFVLRRKPPGPVLSSAHAIDREFRVMSAVHSAGYPVPRPYLYCEDTTIIGTAFYIVEYLEGRVFWNAELRGLGRAERAAIYDVANAELARLHCFDYRDLGLEGFGKTGNYAQRNLERWTAQYRAAQLIDIPQMEWLMRELPNRLPKSERTVLVHGDFGLYNLIIAPDSARLLGVLDWELSTLGDPLIDLAWHTRVWWDPPDRERGSTTSLNGMDLQTLGIPSMQEYVASYCARAGIGSIDDPAFYLGFVQFRYAAIIQGILKRARDGASANRAMLYTQERVIEVAQLACATLRQS